VCGKVALLSLGLCSYVLTHLQIDYIVAVYFSNVRLSFKLRWHFGIWLNFIRVMPET
jgi:hypothetical protein